MFEHTAAEEVYSAIPVPTWRWTGVNKKAIPKKLAGQEAQTAEIHVKSGESMEVVLRYREQGIGAVKAVVETGGKLDLSVVQIAPHDKERASSLEIEVAKDAELRLTIVEAGAKESVSKFIVDLAGDRAKADIASVYFVDGKRRLDLNYLVRHRGKETDASMYIDGALLDEAEKTFRGTLDFVRGSSSSVGREKETVMLLSPKVRNRSVPLMLSGEGDVDGQHAVSIGKMDEAKLFYLMSRGLDLAEARRLVVEASFLPVLDRLPEESLREEIRSYVKRRIGDAAN
ncbi:hypothetical protein TAMA11512_17940 [Selenomonas sp. TAMA-11512]|uniref:SufD family Fe-S cluster assembly protein n=1 Tax=Selenomonas sp. TAMA-11512 TaxID=3095337 RepID=UPI003092C80D|nr:hypothetical protein TAMA11512_17940 [Selenomonas sp. TAMA-11512]